MKEELMNIIDSEYDKIEVETSSNDLDSINKQIEDQNKQVEEELNNSSVVTEFLQEHNKLDINELTTSEINDLIKKIDEEISNLE